MKLKHLTEVEFRDSDAYYAQILARKNSIEQEMSQLASKIKSYNLRAIHASDPEEQKKWKTEADILSAERTQLQFDLDDQDLKLIELGKNPNRRFGYERLIPRR
jgi:hypothetical protein